MDIFEKLITYSVISYIVGTANALSIAQINNSRIIGQTVTFAGIQAHQYLGISFAEPPLGSLRFQKPQPFQNYPPEFKAFTNPPACPQYTTEPYPWYTNIQRKSEDCLYLNIWTPVTESSGDKKAVMYWMYGGGNRFGSINNPLYNGTRLAVLGDIVVVTVNYRLGYFGFLTSDSSDAPGNVGVWDVLEGLKWVNRYIGSFGGDASRITIAGRSSGAVDVGLLSISPLARGLYARQIMQSLAPVTHREDSNTQNLALSQQLAEYVGCASDSFTISAHPKEVVQCLRAIDAERISKADYELAPRSNYHLGPQFGDELLVENPRVSVIKGNFRCTDLLIGSNHDEGSNKMTVYEYQDYFGIHGEKNPHVNRSLAAEIIRTSAKSFPDLEAILNYYLPANLTDDKDYHIRTQTYTAIGDVELLCPTVYYADKCAEQQKNVYYYFFDHRPSNSPFAPWMGVTHGDEEPFVFGTPILNSDYEISEYRLSKQIIDIWSTFVKTGAPGIPWPLYSSEDRMYRYIGPEYVTEKNGVNGPHAQNCKFLRPYFGF